MAPGTWGRPAPGQVPAFSDGRAPPPSSPVMWGESGKCAEGSSDGCSGRAGPHALCSLPHGHSLVMCGLSRYCGKVLFLQYIWQMFAPIFFLALNFTNDGFYHF